MQSLRTLCLFTLAGLALSAATAHAGPVCRNVGINPTVLVCTPAPLAAANANAFPADQRLIDTGEQKDRFTFVESPEQDRPESWALGNPRIKACKFCITPNMQNAARMKALKGE